MPVNKTNLFFSRGDTYVFSCLAQDYSQTVINLTGATILSTVKRSPADSAPLFTGTCAVVSAPAGTLTVTFAAASTASLPDYPQVLVYDVQVTKSGAVITIQSGKIYLSSETLP